VLLKNPAIEVQIAAVALRS